MITDRFDFASAGRILFGRGRIAELPDLIKPSGKKVMLVTGGHPGRHDSLRILLEKAGIIVAVESVSGEPTVQRVSEITDSILRQQCEVVAGIGGGSVIDAAKAAAALANNPGDIMDYLEVVGAGKPLPQPALPYIAIPTTAGTGAEVTKNSVITVPDQHVKVSLRSPFMLPRFALVDPDLALECPPEVSVNCGFDALCHLIEAYLSAKATPMSDAVCREGLSRMGGGALVLHWMRPEDPNVMVNVSLGSLLGGMALANGGLGAVHGFAGVIGGMTGAPHGAVCAALLPAVLRMNLDIACQGKQPLCRQTMARINETALMLSRDVNSKTQDLITLIENMSTQQNVAGLEKLGVKRAEFPVIIEKSSRASSMKGNPFLLTAEQLFQILDESF
jgi:alcohol dehydrogenase class IV